MILLAEQPSEIHQAVTAGTISITAAISLARKEKDPTKRKDVVAKAGAKGETVKVREVDGLSQEDTPFGGPSTEDNDDQPQYQGMGKGTRTKTETKEALDAEMKSRETSGKHKESRRKDDRGDALSSKIDRPDEEWETNLKRAKSNLDKLHLKSRQLPKELAQHSSDMVDLCNWSIKAIEESEELLRKIVFNETKD